MSGAVAPPVAAQGFAVPVSSSSYAGPDESRPTSPSPLSNSRSFPFILKASGSARHTIGIFLLLVTVFLWTASQFLASVCVLTTCVVLQELMVLSDHLCRRYIFKTIPRDLYQFDLLFHPPYISSLQNGLDQPQVNFSSVAGKASVSPVCPCCQR